MISPLTPKSSSTPSSSRAFCSSASLERVVSRTTFFGSERKCSVGISNSAEPISEVCASRWMRAPGSRARRRSLDARSRRRKRNVADLPAQASVVVLIVEIDRHRPISDRVRHHRGEEFRLDAGTAVGADPRFGALGMSTRSAARRQPLARSWSAMSKSSWRPRLRRRCGARRPARDSHQWAMAPSASMPSSSSSSSSSKVVFLGPAVARLRAPRSRQSRSCGHSRPDP